MKAFCRLLKNWTLPVAIATGVCVYLLFHFVPFLQPIGKWYAPYNGNLMPDFMFLILYVTFCKIDFRKLHPVRWHFWICAQQMVFVLALMLVAIGLHVTGKPLIMLEAILACVICPCAAAAPVVTAKLGGNLEEMTTYMFVSNFITAMLIPLCFPMLPQATEAASNIHFVDLFLQILWKVSVVLLLPMLLAFVTKHGFKRFHHRLVSIKDLSYYLWGCSLVIVSGTTAMNITEAWHETSLGLLFAICAMAMLLCVVQFATGRLIGRHFNATVEAGQSLGQKNTALAIWVATAFLNPLSSVGPGCYILWQNIINSAEIWIYRRKGLEQCS